MSGSRIGLRKKVKLNQQFVEGGRVEQLGHAGYRPVRTRLIFDAGDVVLRANLLAASALYAYIGVSSHLTHAPSWVDLNAEGREC
jgi:hypothetical protein